MNLYLRMISFQFAELETLLGDADRARAIFDIAVQQPALDMPEVEIEV